MIMILLIPILNTMIHTVNYVDTLGNPMIITGLPILNLLNMGLRPMLGDFLSDIDGEVFKVIDIIYTSKDRTSMLWTIGLEH